jgi:hypothetical protein
MAMQLTAQQLSDVVTSLRQSGPGASAMEQRRFNRMEVQAKVAVASIGEGNAPRCYTALTRDISFGGLGLMQSLVAEQGGRLLVRLPRGEKAALMMVCATTHCRVLADGLYGVGVEFLLEADVESSQQLANAMEHERQRIKEAMLK